MDSATVAAAKLHPVLRKYALRRVRLPVGASLLNLVLPDARDWLRRGVGAAFEPHRVGWEPPYWLQVWPAAVAIARLVARHGVAGRRVVDMGCGLGVPGIAAARAGAAVTFVDREPDALEFALWNGQRSREGALVRQQQLDWAVDVVDGEFDVVLLADVSYRSMHHAPLQRQLESCLGANGVVVHAEPVRPEARPFLAWLRSHHATYETTRMSHGPERAVEVRICVASRGAANLAPWRASLEHAAGQRSHTT